PLAGGPAGEAGLPGPDGLGAGDEEAGDGERGRGAGQPAGPEREAACRKEAGMGGNPVEMKVEAGKPADVLAAVAGVPTPPKAGGLWAKVWHHRKLALILGGSGLVLGGGGYGYKYFTPGRANAQPELPAVASAPEPVKPKPTKTTDLPDVPTLDLPVPPAPGNDGRKTTKDNDGPGLPVIQLPPTPGVKAPTDRTKSADGPADTFKATDPIETGDKDKSVKTGPSPMPLPTDVTQKREKPAGPDVPL